MTSWWHRTRIVIIFRQFQNPVQPIFKSWRNRKRGTLYVCTRKAPLRQCRKSAGTSWRSRETSWPKELSEISDNSNILRERICEPSFYGNWQLICALSRLSRPLSEYLFTEANSSDLQLSATYGNLNTGSATSTMLCQPLPSYAKFAKNGFSVFKSQIRRKISDSQH